MEDKRKEEICIKLFKEGPNYKEPSDFNEDGYDFFIWTKEIQHILEILFNIPVIAKKEGSIIEIEKDNNQRQFCFMENKKLVFTEWKHIK